MDYYETTTYLVFDKNTGLPLRWNKSKELGFFLTKEDALSKLDSNKYSVIPVAECSDEIIIEFKKLIDKEL